MNPVKSRRSLWLLSILTACASGGPAECADAPVSLTVAGKPAATIVLAKRPRSSAQLAAFELQYYLRKITGATIPIKHLPAKVAGTQILVGESAATKVLGVTNQSFGEQEYLVETRPGTLILVGRDREQFDKVDYSDYLSIYHSTYGPLGTCNAVHSFLENQLGIRWYYPNEQLGEVVPQRSTLRVGALRVRRRLSAPVRQIYPLFTNTRKLYFIDYDKPERLKSSWVDNRLSLLYWIRLRFWAGKAYNANHSFHGYDKAFGKSHPEWFSSKSYSRMKKLRFQFAIQPCLTAVGFEDQVVRIARDYFAGKKSPYPDVFRAANGKFFSIVPNDNSSMCRCPTCLPLYRPKLGGAGEASHYVWSFVNRVARKVRKTHPDAMFSGLAYFNYTKPPSGLVFEPNVAVTFCKFYQRYHDKNYQARDYERIRQYVTKNKARFFTTYEYPCHPFMSNLPFPCLAPRTQAEDVRRLRKIPGFMGGTMDRTAGGTYRDGKRVGLCWSSPVMDFMNVYWRAKLYDDFDYDVEKGLKEYYRLFFGPAARPMDRFYTAIEDRWMKRGGASGANQWWERLGTPKFLQELKGYIAAAHQAAPAGTIYRRRVALIDAGIMKYLLKARANYERTATPLSSPMTVAASPLVTADQQWWRNPTWSQSLVNRVSRESDAPAEPSKNRPSQPSKPQTRFKLAHDQRFAYVLVKCQEPDIDNLVKKIRSHDIDNSSDDSIEFLLASDQTKRQYYRICVNSVSAIYDAKVDPQSVGAKDDTRWNSQAKARVKVGKSEWEIRIRIPLASIGVQLQTGRSTLLRLNVIRNRWASRPMQSVWSAVVHARQVSRFGLVNLNRREDKGRLIWSCNFESPGFGAEPSLFGVNGWFENPNYANRGWTKSWRVVKQNNTTLASCDLNETCSSDVMPFHAVQVQPGRFSIEANFRRSNLAGSMPLIDVRDASGAHLSTLYAWPGRGDLVGLEQNDKNGGRQNYSSNQHKLGKFTSPGRWFGLKLVMDTVKRQQVGFVRTGNGKWVQLNRKPLPYYHASTEQRQLFVALGSRLIKAIDTNRLEMDNIRLIQLEP